MPDDVFKALADPGRRALLDALRERDGRSLTELAAVLPGMTRFGVAGHLAVLEAAGLVVPIRVGREKHHHLNPVPLQEVAERWLSPFTSGVASRLLALRDELHRQEGPAVPTTDSVYRIVIRSPREAVWAALTATGSPRAWMYGSTMRAEWRPGEAYAMTGGGDEQIVGTVLEVEPPARLLMTFDARWDDEVAPEAPGTLEYRLRDAGDGATELTVLMTGLGPETAASVEEGNAEMYSALKTELETGAPMRAAG